jgi:hypothetical protein
MRTAGATTILTLTVRGGRLDPSGIVVRDGAIADGRATLELWQGGIGSSIRSRSFGDLAVRVTRATGRLVVDLAAPAETFAALRARLVANGVVVELERPAVVPSGLPPSARSGPSASPSPLPPQPPQTTTGGACCNAG